MWGDWYAGMGTNQGVESGLGARWRERKRLARTAPETECQMQAMAQSMAASGICGKCRVASTVASPAFCIPTSMDRVRR